MTAITPAIAPGRGLGRRLANVVRLHLANPFTILITPLMVLGIIFLANWVIWWLISVGTTGDRTAIENASKGLQYSGASLWTFIYMMVVAIQAMNLTFPFALGFGSTRRDYALGTALAFTGLSAVFAIVYFVMAALETATGGWGMGGAMFTTIFFGIDLPWYEWLFNVFAAFLFFFAIGSMFGAIYVRFKARGTILFFLALALVLIGGVALITLSDGWGVVADVFVTLGFTGSYAASLGLSAIAATAGYLILQRATPRS